MTKIVELGKSRRLQVTVDEIEKLVSLSAEERYNGEWNPDGQQLSVNLDKWNLIVQTVAGERH